MTNPSRRPLARLSLLGVTYLHTQNPAMVAWWSAVFPGFGHFILNQFLRGTLLTLSEVIINTLTHINEAMVLSFCGRFEQAKAILEPRWMFGYIIVYLICIGDSYRSCLVQNKLCHLARLENEPLPSLKLSMSEVQYLEKKSPFTALAYSFLFPGLGQLYNHRFALAFYAILWWWIYVSLSRAHESLMLILLGRLPESVGILHPHWLLFMPSVMGGAVYHAYTTAIEHNALYRLEQRQHLSRRYSHSGIILFPRAGAGK